MEPKPSRKLFFTMGEVTEMFDVKSSLIRYWEENFDTLRPRKNNKGNRMFTPKDIETLKLIYYLVREKGMTIAGANKYIKENRNSAERDVQILDHLARIRTELMAIRQEIADCESETQIIIPNVVAPADDVELASSADLESLLDSGRESSAQVQESRPAAPRYVEPTLFDF